MRVLFPRSIPRLIKGIDFVIVDDSSVGGGVAGDKIDWSATAAAAAESVFGNLHSLSSVCHIFLLFC